MRGGRCYELPTWEPTIDEHDGGAFATPSAAVRGRVWGRPGAESTDGHLQLETQSISNPERVHDDKSGYGTSAICREGGESDRSGIEEDVADYDGNNGTTSRPDKAEIRTAVVSESGSKSDRKGWWELKSGLGKLDHGIPSEMDSPCNQVNPHDRMSYEQNMQTVRETINTETVWISTGRQRDLPKEEVLRSDLYGEGNDQGRSNEIGITQKSEQIQEERMSGMQSHKESECSSYRFKYREQSARKSNDSLFGVSYEMALGTREKGMEETREMSPLRTHGQEEQSLPDSRKQEETERGSSSKKSSDEGRVDHNTGWWESEPYIGRVATGIKDRVHRLKGLGNAQVPLQAAVAWRILGGE
jgi:hypothetical protein